MGLFAEKSDDIHEYYCQYFSRRENVMGFPVRDGELYDWLSGNIRGWGAYKDRKDMAGKNPPSIRAAIRSAADEFYVIEKGRTEIIVPYGESAELLDQYEKALANGDDAKRRKLLRQLSRYGVSLYPYQLTALEKAGAIHNKHELRILAGGFYDAERGMDINGQHEFLMI
jgi:CRISPR-associated endonuclease/helicase Cas3